MKWTIYKASIEWNVDAKTLKKGLVLRGLEIKKGGTYTTRQICDALYSDLDRERTLEVIERRKALEKDNAERDGVLMETQEVVRFYTEALLPIRQRFLALPNECATRVNPTDPQFAREALQRWVDEALPMIRSQLPKPKATSK